MDRVMLGLPQGTQTHVILDNYCIHKKNDAWLASHPNVSFHFTLKHQCAASSGGLGGS